MGKRGIDQTETGWKQDEDSWQEGTLRASDFVQKLCSKKKDSPPPKKASKQKQNKKCFSLLKALAVAVIPRAEASSPSVPILALSSAPTSR
jgi:hypothetical protein